MPSLPPELLAMAVFSPMTSPRRLTSGPPLVAGVDGGVGLKEVLVGHLALRVAQVEVRPALGADDAARNALPQVERAAEGEHHVADLGVVAVADPGRAEVPGLDPKDGDVCLPVAPDLQGAELPAVVQFQAYQLLAGVLDDMPVGEHVVAAPQPHQDARAGLFDVAPEAVLRKRCRLDVHHRRRNQLHDAFEDAQLLVQLSHVPGQGRELGLALLFIPVGLARGLASGGAG